MEIQAALWRDRAAVGLNSSMVFPVSPWNRSRRVSLSSNAQWPVRTTDIVAGSSVNPWFGHICLHCSRVTTGE